MDLSAAVEKQLAGEVIKVARLIETEWASGTERYWSGEYRLTTADGRVWQPTMGVATGSGLSQALNGEAPEIKVSLSGVDKVFGAKAVGEAKEYFGRRILFYTQFFDEAWQVLDNPVPITWGLMRNIIAKMETTDQGMLHTVTLTAESPWAGRARAPMGFYTDRDQKTLHPTPTPDRMCQRTAGLEARLIIFPRFEGKQGGSVVFDGG